MWLRHSACLSSVSSCVCPTAAACCACVPVLLLCVCAWVGRKEREEGRRESVVRSKELSWLRQQFPTCHSLLPSSPTPHACTCVCMSSLCIAVCVAGRGTGLPPECLTATLVTSSQVVSACMYSHKRRLPCSHTHARLLCPCILSVLGGCGERGARSD